MAKEDRGFASMDRSKQREIASKGGKAAHQKGTAHEWTSEEAREAGRKGGMASHRRKQEQQAAATSRTSSRRRRTTDRRERSNPRADDAATDDCRRRRDAARRQRARLPVPFWSGYNRKFLPLAARRLALGGRPTVGHMALDQVIGVRIPASQPNITFDS